jgi:hypothetical protein
MKGCERDPRKEQVTMEHRSERDSVFKQRKENILLQNFQSNLSLSEAQSSP